MAYVGLGDICPTSLENSDGVSLMMQTGYLAEMIFLDFQGLH